MLPLAATVFAASWIQQAANTTAALRGLCAVSSDVAWASGTNGTYLRTVDGGKHWFAATVPGAGSLDFRDVKAFDERTAYLVSSGPGDQSRIYKTTDGGARWTLLFQNPDAKGFFDAIGFWDRTHGILLGDPVNSQFAIFTTGAGVRPGYAAVLRQPYPARAPSPPVEPQLWRWKKPGVVRHGRTRRRPHFPYRRWRTKLDCRLNSPDRSLPVRWNLFAGIPR